MNRFYLFNDISTVKTQVCGQAFLNPGWIHMKRCLEKDSVLIMGKTNSAVIHCGDQNLEVNPGRIILLPSGVLHYGEKPIETSCSYYWIHFHCDSSPEEISDRDAFTVLADPKVAFERYENSLILPVTIEPDNSSELENLFVRILEESETPSFCRQELNVLTQTLLIHIAKMCFTKTEKKSEGKDYLIRKILSVIHHELSNPDCSVKFVSSELGFNSDYIGRIFREYMMTSLGSYISRKRIELSCERLRNTVQPIDEILVQCGFGSRRQFYDEFKAVMKSSPAKYRKQVSLINSNIL